MDRFFEASFLVLIFFVGINLIVPTLDLIERIIRGLFR